MRLLAEERTIAWTLLVGEYNMTQDRGWGERQLLRTNNQDVRQVLPGIRVKEGPLPSSRNTAWLLVVVLPQEGRTK